MAVLGTVVLLVVIAMTAVVYRDTGLGNRQGTGTEEMGTTTLNSGTLSSRGGSPLSKERTNMVPLDEIFLLGRDLGGDDLCGMAWDDANHSYDVMHNWEADDNTTQPCAASGDPDGDGREEVLFAGTDRDGNLNIWAWEDPLSNWTLMHKWEAGVNADDPTIAAGDIDGDGADEVIVFGIQDDNLHGWAWNDEEDDWAEMKHWVEDEQYEDYERPDVTVGDVDGDGLDEIAVYVRKGTDDSVFVWDDFDHDFNQLKAFDPQGNSENRPLIVTGDVDGDEADELILVSEYLDMGTWYIRASIHDDAAHEFEEMSRWDQRKYGGNASLASGDIDGDGLDEYVVSATYDSKLYAWTFDDGEHDFSEMKELERNGVDRATAVDIGDIDCDGVAEIVFMGEHSIDENVKGWAIDDAGNGYAELEDWVIEDVGGPVLTLGDFDADGIVLEYTGDHWTTTTDPRVLVAMAIPPVVDGITQNHDETGSAYGTEVSQGTGSSYEVGTTASATLSFEAGDPFGIAEVSFSATLSEEFSTTEAHSKIETYGTSYESAYPDDVVIYAATIYDNYKYKIVSHPDPEQVGQNMTIDIPRKTDIYKQSIDYFNDHNGNVPDIGRETFQHKPGAVWSYPSRSEKNAVLDSYHGWSSGDTAVQVGQGGGTTSVNINLEEEQTTEESRTMGCEISAGMSVAGVGFEMSVGAFTTEVFQTTIGKSTEYQGTVGDINDVDDYDNNSYSFGMFVYTFQPSPSVSYQVINYWVENYVGPVPDQKLLGHWQFDEESDDKAKDQSPWQRDGTIAGALHTDDAVHGKALAFDGNNAVMEAETHHFSTSAGSFESWVNFDEPNGNRTEALFSAPAEGTVDDTGMLGRWSMNEDSWGGRKDEVMDTSGNKHHGTAKNGLDTTSLARFGKTGNFDGHDDYISCGGNPDLRPETSVSVSCWAFIRTMEKWDGIVSYAWDTGDDESGYELHFHSGKVHFRVAAQGTGFASSPGFTPQLNVWYHFVGTYDGSAVRLFVNGVEQGNGTAVSGKIDWTYGAGDVLYIGKFHDDNENNEFNGMIDEVMVYKRPLNANEIWDQYHFGIMAYRTSLGELVFRVGGAQVKNNAPDLSGWHHITGTWTARSIELYVNGKIVGETNTTADIGEHFASLCYLGNDETRSMGLNGKLDEVKFHDYALSSDEVYASFRSKWNGSDEKEDDDSTPDDDDDDDDDDTNGGSSAEEDGGGNFLSSTGGIALLVGLGLLIAALIVFFVYAGKRRQKEKEDKSSDTEEQKEDVNPETEIR